jgi:hypothetical protein
VYFFWGDFIDTLGINIGLRAGLEIAFAALLDLRYLMIYIPDLNK